MEKSDEMEESKRQRGRKAEKVDIHGTTKFLDPERGSLIRMSAKETWASQKNLIWTEEKI